MSRQVIVSRQANISADDSHAGEDKINVSDSNGHAFDFQVRTLDDNLRRCTCLRAAELRQRGWFMVR